MNFSNLLNQELQGFCAYQLFLSQPLNRLGIAFPSVRRLFWEAFTWTMQWQEKISWKKQSMSATGSNRSLEVGRIQFRKIELEQPMDSVHLPDKIKEFTLEARRNIRFWIGGFCSREALRNLASRFLLFVN